MRPIVSQKYFVPRMLCFVVCVCVQVVCAIVLRDLEGLVDRYLRKMRKSFARMYWDEDYEDYEDEEETTP